MALSYRHVVSSQFEMIDGVDHSQAIVPGTGNRYAVVKRKWGNEFCYAVRDAETVSDSKVRGGVKPHVVFQGETEAEAVAWCKGHL